MTSIAAVVTTRNRPHELRRAIDSIRSQTTAAHEIIVVDDGSTPPVDLQDYDNLTLIRNDEALGPAGARNLGALSASSDFVAFLDDDDWWHPTKIETITRCLRDAPTLDVVFHRLGNANQVPHEGRCHELKDPVARMLLARPPHMSTITVRRSLHLDVLFDASYPGAEDLDYNIRLAERARSVAEVEQVLAVFGGSPTSPSDVSVQSRIDGRLRFRTDHDRLFVDRSYELQHAVQLGHLYLRAGQRRQALRSFATAVRSDPTDSRPWKGIAWVCLPPIRRPRA